MERNPERSTRRPRNWILPASIGVPLILLIGWIVLTPKADPEVLLRQASVDLAAKRHAEVEEAVRKLAKLRPPSVEDWLLRAELARATGKNGEAIEALSHVPDTHPRAPAVWLARGLLELQQDRVRPAEAAFREALRLDPASADPRRELIRIASFQNRPEVIAAEFTELARRGVPLTFDDLYLWTLRRSRTVGSAEVADTLGRWVKADPADDLSRIGLATVLRKLGKLAEAEDVVDAPVGTSSTRLVTARARIALDGGDVSGARRLLNAAPIDDPEIALLLGQVALAESEPKAALAFFQSAARIWPDDREVLFGMAQCLRLNGAEAQAKSLAKRVTARDDLERLVQQAQVPDQQISPKVLASIAKACEGLGSISEARAWYRLASKYDPTDAAIRAAVFRLYLKGG